MKDRLPYEEDLASQLSELPLPDENMAWEDMRRRLDDDDNVFIPFWLRGCGLWAMLAIILLAFGWWLIRSEKRKHNEPVAAKVMDTTQNNQKYLSKGGSNSENDSVQEDYFGSKANHKLPNASAPDIQKESLNQVQEVTIKKIKNESASNQTHALNREKQKIKESSGPDFNKKVKAISIRRDSMAKRDSVQLFLAKDKMEDLPERPESTTDSVKTHSTDILVPVSDSSSKILKETDKPTLQEPIAKASTLKKDSTKPKKISFGAGFSIQQQLPVNGQKLVPYNSLGRKGSLADYIPSVYLRMYIGDKWFLQSAFHYGAPQSTKEIIYEQLSVSDSIGGQQFTTTTSNKLKKTYYHQLPLTFNYFIHPNWSVGTGIVWNKFSSAIYQREIVRRNDQTAQDSIISKKIGYMKQGRDSASIFSKDYFQTVVETQYNWRRFSLGARYLFGWQPFIKFNLPGAGTRQEKNSSLQFFFRYELWRSGK